MKKEREGKGGDPPFPFYQLLLELLGNLAHPIDK
jgi:hypothetical protein